LGACDWSHPALALQGIPMRGMGMLTQLEKITGNSGRVSGLFSQGKTERRYAGNYVKATCKKEGNKHL